MLSKQIAEKLKKAEDNCMEALEFELSLRKENIVLKKRIKQLESYNALLLREIRILRKGQKQNVKKNTEKVS